MPRDELQKTGRWRRRVLLVIFSTLISLVGVEALLRIFDFADPPVFEENPDYGYLMKPNQWVSTWGHRFHINRAGFRGIEFATSKSSDTYRIAFLGDSITYGGGSIPDGTLFVNKVTSALRGQVGDRIEAINISVPGWGIENLTGYVEKMGFFQADLLVWVVSAADFRRPKTYASDYGFPDRKPRSRLLYALSRSFRVLTGGLFRRPSQSPAPSSAETLKRNLLLFRGTLAKTLHEGARVAVVMVPTEDGELAQDRDAFRAAADGFSVPFLDTMPILQQQRPKELFQDGVHLNPSGHELVAAAIAEFLKEKVFAAHSARGVN
jgi:lysophospholipase L1-like esterase